MHRSLKENIDWVGFIDWHVRDFHSYNTKRGATYNAYLVRDTKTALIDTVKAPYAETLLQNVQELVDLAEIDYVISNHGEPDHSGGLPRVMQALPDATLICDEKCRQSLAAYYDTSSWKMQIVGSGDALSLGSRTLQFLETPMVHWPDSMFTYIPEDKLLFSMDAFGQHYATTGRFDDEVPLCTIMEEAKIYYANIVMPYGKRVSGVLAKAAELEIDMIAPSHGLIWRRHIAEILAAYQNWAACKTKRKIVVIYDTMWDSTGEMGAAIVAGAAANGVETQLIHIRRSDLTTIATEMLDAAAVAFGSSTLNQNMMPMAAAVLTYLKGLRPLHKAAFAFGSHGWGKGGPEAVDETLRELNWEIVREPLKAKYKPTPEVLAECREAGAMLAARAKDISAREAGQKLCVEP